MTNVYQCCYTNAERSVAGKVRDSGWDFVNVSKDIPGAAMRTCQSIQKRYSDMLGDMRDERGQAIRDFYEIVGNSSYLFVTRTRYGLLDRVGRPNLFSHAFIFPAKSAAPSPERFLYPDFKASIEETSDCQPQILGAPDSLAEAIANAGLGSREHYAALIQCAYLNMAAQLPQPLISAPASLRDAPLYIQYDGTPEQFQQSLRCVYSAFPYYLRARLSASVYASARNAADAKRNLIFTADAKAQGGFYFILPKPGHPDSCENNVVSGLNVRSADIIGNSYISYAARYLEPELFAPFFEGLDACAKALGDADASNDRVLNIAWKHFWNPDTLQWDAKRWDRNAGKFSLREDIPHDELKRLLSNILSCEIYSGGLASLALQILETVGEGNLTDNLREKWKKYQSRVESDEAASDADSPKAVETSAVVVNPKEALKRLLNIPLFKTSNQTLEETFSKYSQTPEVLVSYCDALFKLEPVSWDSLRGARLAIKFIPEPNGLDNRLYAIANDIYCADIMIGNNPAWALREYEQAASMVVKDPHELRSLLDSMRSLYWDAFEWNKFDFHKADEYRFFRIEGQENAAFSLLALEEQYIPGDESAFLWKVHQYFMGLEGKVPPAERITILKKLCVRLTKERYAPLLYEDWVQWASYVNVGKGYIDVLCRLYDALNPFDVSKLLEACVLFSRWSVFWNPEGLSKEERMRMIMRVESSCIQNDYKTPVPLDLWLFIGAQICKNPFEIFDYLFDAYKQGAFKKEPAIFRQNAAEVVRSSMLFSNMSRQAWSYADSPGKRKPRVMVKRWLEEWAKLYPPPISSAPVNSPRRTSR